MSGPSFVAATAKSLQSCPTLCDPIDGSPPGSHPWDSPGKNTGVGCHFRLQCMKVKSEYEVAQSCPTLSDPMDCSLPGSSTHGIFQARVLEWGTIAFSDSKEPACQCRRHGDAGLILGSRKSPGGGHGNPSQYSCLENPMDRGAWWATVHRGAESDMTEVTLHARVQSLLD